LSVDAIKNVVNELPKMSRRRVGALIQNLTTGRLARLKGVAQGYYRQADKILGKTKTVTREITEDVQTNILDMNGNPVVKQVTRTIEDVVPENGVDIIPLKKFAAKELKALEGGIGGNPKLAKDLKAILDKPDVITYSSAQQIRTELFETSQQFARGAMDITPANKRVATAMTVPLSRAMGQAATKAGPEAKALIKKADQIWREEVRGELTQKFITKLANNQADDVLDAIVASGRPGDIRMIRDIVMKEQPEAWAAVQGAFLQRLIFANAEKRLVGDGVELTTFNGKNLIDDMTRIAKEDGSVLRELFPDQYGKSGAVLTRFKRYIQALESTQRPLSGEGTGAVFIQLGQAGAVGTALGATSLWVSGNIPVGGVAGAMGVAAAYLLLPRTIGRMFKNPEIVKWLTIGAKHAPGSVPAMKASLATLGLMLKNKLLRGDDEERAMKQMESINLSLKEKTGK
jgi:hypothetical protein